MFKVTVTTTATSLWDLALTEENRDALLEQMNSRKMSWCTDNIYIQNLWALDIAVASTIEPTITTWILLSAGNENEYRVLDLNTFYLISSGSNTDVIISWL